jgi:hypothetical protein
VKVRARNRRRYLRRRPTVSEIVYTTLRSPKYQAAMVANVTRNNVLLTLLKAKMPSSPG